MDKKYLYSAAQHHRKRAARLTEFAVDKTQTRVSAVLRQ